MSSIARQEFLDGVEIKTNDIVGHTMTAANPSHGLAFKKETHDWKSFGEEVDGVAYDLVVVGAGLSGLAAAHFFQKRFGKDKKILVLDSQNDFGGHAKRNEFLVDNKTRLIGYGGSESLQSPKTNFSPQVHELLNDLGIDLDKWEGKDGYFKHIFPASGLSRASFFDKETFGADVLVPGDPTDWVSDEIPKDMRNGVSIQEFVSKFPLSDKDKQDLIALYTDTKRVTLSDFKTMEEKLHFLEKTSYDSFLKNQWHLSDAARAYFGGRTLDFFGSGPKQVSSIDAFYFHYPGFQGIAGLEKSEEAEGEMEEPYIYHFPDGNASIARLLVRKLIPNAFSSSSADAMETIIMSDIHRQNLDSPANVVRIRLNSSVLLVENEAKSGTVSVGYIDTLNGQKKKVKAKHATLACFAMLIPYILKGAQVKEEQLKALSQNVKVPMIYSNVAVRNWRAWKSLNVHEIYGVNTFHSRVKMDYPVTMGGYKCAQDSSEPCLIHMVHVPKINETDDPRTALRMARKSFFAKPFKVVEEAIKKDLSRMLGKGGFDAERDIAAITVNRWSHGYSWARNTLVDDGDDSAIKAARQRVGNVTIAGSDAQWNPYAHAAIDEAYRAIAEFAAAK